MTLPSIEQARATILGAIQSVTSELIPVGDALGRVLADPLTAPGDIPPGPRSAMDGYAVGSCNRRRFELVGEIPAGASTSLELEPHQAVAIMTGAVVPQGAQAVVMTEAVGTGAGVIEVADDLAAQQLINPAGGDARRGDTLAPAGLRLNAVAHAVATGAGLDRVRVFRRPRVGILVTGDEVCAAGSACPPEGVHDANGVILSGVCHALGCELAPIRRTGDDAQAITEALDDLGRDCDLVISSGGVSRGRRDHVGHGLRAAPDELLLAGTAIKPGRPLHVAQPTVGPPVFAMPGYPSALLVNVFLYLVPALKALSGRTDTSTAWFQASLHAPLRHRPGRQDLARVELTLMDGHWHARSTGSQITSLFLDAARSHGLARLPHTKAGQGPGEPATLPAGATVPVLSFALELS